MKTEIFINFILILQKQLAHVFKFISHWRDHLSAFSRISPNIVSCGSIQG